MKTYRPGHKVRSGPSPGTVRRLAAFLAVAVVVGGVLGFYSGDLAKWAGRMYLSVKQADWQPRGAEKKQVQQALATISDDPGANVNTLVIGSDQGSNPGETGYCRSDVMMLVCLREREKKAVVLSIPRDTMVTLPGYGTQKINAANAFGGPSAAINAVRALTGIDVNHYVSLDFEGFMKMVDAVGGIPVHLSKPISDPHAGYVPAGDQVLDGPHALAVVRSRRLPAGDVDRIKNQQLFLEAAFAKLDGERSVMKAKQLVDIFASTCQTDYTAGQVETLAEELRGFPIENVQFVTVPGNQQYIDELSYFIANQRQLQQLATEIDSSTQVSSATLASLETASDYQGDVEQEISPGTDKVTVLAGTRSTADEVPVVTEELRLLGHQTVKSGTATSGSEETAVYYHEGAQQTRDRVLAEIPELTGAAVAQDDDVTSLYNSPVVVVLGGGFRSPGLDSVYGRIMAPAVAVHGLGATAPAFNEKR